MFDQVKEILIKQLKLKNVEVTLDSKIKDDLGADSLDTLQLLMTLEDKYGITIPDDELMKFVTVGDVVNYLEKLELPV
ncbi:MAG: acyl carrier protein [Clostridia bacterium]|nr:acyl carrier protein [Clostridia bacterium]